MVSSNDIVQKHVEVYHDPYEAAKNVHSIVILTEWDEFKDYDYEKIYQSMKKPASLFDGRLLVDHQKLDKIGFRVFSIGMSPNKSMKSFK